MVGSVSIAALRAASWLTGKPTSPLGSVNIAEDEFDHGSGGVEERQMATILSKIEKKKRDRSDKRGK